MIYVVANVKNIYIYILIEPVANSTLRYCVSRRKVMVLSLACEKTWDDHASVHLKKLSWVAVFYKA